MERMIRFGALFLLLASIHMSESEEDKKGTAATFSDYLPMQFVAASRSATQTGGATKALFYDFLPTELKGRKPDYLEIRSLFSGSVKVIESAQFGVSVNVSSRSTYDLASVEVQYTAVNGTILLQLKNEEPMIYGGLTSLITFGIVFGAIMAIVLIVTCAYLCFWLVKFEGKDEDRLAEESWRVKQTEISLSVHGELIGDGNDTPSTHNGDINRQLYARRGDSSSDNNSGKPSSMGHRRQRYRASTQRSRDISSSDEVSSIDDNWTRRKASWRKGHAQKRTQFSDFDVTSGDGGFSSGNEFHPSRNRVRGVHRRNDSLDELEWDEYETGEARLPPPSSNGWQFSADDKVTQDNLWPPPLDEPLLPSDDSDRGADGNLEEVRDAIHNAMDSVNRDAKGFYRLVSCEMGGANQELPSEKPESPHDDGYETGVALNGPSLRSPGLRLSGPPPVAPKPNKGGAGGGGSKPGPSRFTMSLVMSLSLLSLVVGAFGVVSNLTEAEIVIFVPNGFFKEINLFINDTSRISIDVSRKPEQTRVQMFDADDPIVKNPAENLCDAGKGCEHGCNRKTGACVCTQGYLPFEDTKCTDLSDCLYLPCSSTEKCTNTIGSYICTCSDEYWRDESGTCVVCAETSCPPGTYESLGCPDRECLPCSNGCPDGQYISEECSADADTQCETCRAPCLEDEFEYKPCTNLTNRKCNEISGLPAAKGTSNLILESVSNRQTAESSNWLIPPHQSQAIRTTLVRGSGISIKVSVKSMNLYPALRPVVHSASNDNDEFINNGGPPSILTTHCQYPMPVKYQLLSVLHSNVTAAQPNNCAGCAIDPKRSCKTLENEEYGRAAPLDPSNKSMVCSSPDALADMFGLNNYLAESSSIVVQPSRACEVFKQRCDSCSRTCAQGIVGQTNTNCSINSQDDPNSWSPRLMHCQNCCLNRQCRDLCKAMRQCNPMSCWKGNVAEFLLLATFPQNTMEFYCNVELDRRVQLLSLDYSVLHDDSELKNFSVVLFQNETTVKQTSYSDGLLTIDYSTGVQSIPDLIHGELDMVTLSPNYTSGVYTPEGGTASKVDVSRLDIIPREPFSFSTKWWKEHNCSQTIVDKFLIKNGGDIMTAHSEINVSRQDVYTYSLWNRSRQPSIRFKVPVGVSVIQKLYPPTTVDPKTLKATVTKYSSGWRLVVKGAVNTCPGYFTVKVWELNKKKPLAEYEVAVRRLESCQRDFHVTFDIVGGEVHRIQRKFRVELVDKDGRRNFLHADSEVPKVTGITVNSPEQVVDEPETSQRSTIMIMGPYLLIIGVTVIVLSIAWIVSVVIPRDLGPVTSRPKSRAALFVFYCLLRVIYVLATSFSVFAFIWYALNGTDLVIVQDYMAAVDTVISQQQYDLRTLADFSTQTVIRQQTEFQEMRTKCFSNIESLQVQSQQMIQKLSRDMSGELSTLPLRNDLVSSLDERARQLRDRLESYRDNYNSFAQIASSKLVMEISKSVDDFENTDWLSAARMLRRNAASKHFSRSDSVDGFQRWLGMRTQLHSVQANFMMDPLPVVNIDNLSLPPVPSPPQYKTVDLHSVFLPTHDLYSDTKEPQVERADALERSYGISLGTRLSAITVLVILLLLDIVSLSSRVAETLDTGQQILDGYVVEKTYSSTYQDGCSSEKYIADKVIKKPHRVRYRLYKLMLETDCVPLTVALIMIIGFTFVSLISALTFVSLESLSTVGLFSSLVGPWNLTSNIALDNIHMNMVRINTVDIPSTETMMNHYIERIEILNNVYNNLSYYKWQIECGESPSARCGEFDYSGLVQPLDIKDMNCTLEPMSRVSADDIPRSLTDLRVKGLVLPYVEAFRRILESSASLVLTYTSYILIVKMLSSVLWNFLTRTAFIPGVRERITNEPPRPENNEGDNREESDRVPTHMTFNRSTIEELSQEGSFDEDEGLSDAPIQSDTNQELDHEPHLPNGGLHVLAT